MAETRVSRFELPGQVTWRKTYSEGGHARRIAALRWLARRLGADALLAPYPQGPEAACRTELAMIQRLAALGVRVPRVLEAGQDHLLLSDLGPTLAATCRHEPDADRRRELVALGLEALHDLHHRGGYVSQAFARNLTIDAHGIGFIDLEEDPATMMPLAAAQARDVLFYAHSTARFLADVPGEHARLLARHLGRESEAVRQQVARTTRALAWLAPLASPFGARARAVGEALRSLRDATA